MYALATTTVSILRGTSVDEYGDAYDNGTVAASGIPAAVVEESRRTYDRATQTPRTIRAVRGTLGSGVDVREGDQLRDDRTGLIYAVQAVTQPGGVGMTPDLDVDLIRVT